jgi:uncharacterized protein (UPF0335 family)
MANLSDIDALMSGDDDSPGKGVDASYRVTSAELRAFVERIEQVQAEKAELSEVEKEIKAEAKARGYDVKVMNTVIAMRKRNADDLAEEGAILEMYLEALGMSLG